MEFDPNDQARLIANRAKVREVYESALANGDINLLGIKESVQARIKDIQHDLLTAYFFGDDEKIQHILDAAERLRLGYEILEQEIEKHPEAVDRTPPCGNPHCNATDHEVHVLKKSDLLRILFGH